MALQRLRRLVALGLDDADARADDDVAAVYRHGLAQRGLDACGDLGGLPGIADALEHDDELVAPEPGDGVLVADDGRETGGDLAQQLVARAVAEAVVDDLEAVEVEQEDGEAAAAARADGERV